MSKQEKDWSVRITHMVQVCEEMQIYTADMQAEDFFEDLKTIRAVERCFSILGEAANRIPKDIQKNYPAIEWSDIIGMRHIITHDYDRTRDMTIWMAVQNKVPELLETLKDIKSAMEEE